MNVAVSYEALLCEVWQSSILCFFVTNFCKKICHSGPLSPEPRSSRLFILRPNLGPVVKPQDDIGEFLSFLFLNNVLLCYFAAFTGLLRVRSQ